RRIQMARRRIEVPKIAGGVVVAAHGVAEREVEIDRHGRNEPGARKSRHFLRAHRAATTCQTAGGGIGVWCTGRSRMAGSRLGRSSAAGLHLTWGGAMQVFGTHDDVTRAQLAQVAERARKVALMGDGHVGYVMPIGGVAAYENQVSVVGVGFDIACVNAASRTDATLADLGATPEEVQRRLAQLADRIAETVSFGIGRKNRA